MVVCWEETWSRILSHLTGCPPAVSSGSGSGSTGQPGGACEETQGWNGGTVLPSYTGEMGGVYSLCMW